MKPIEAKPMLNKAAVTLLELLVVVLIIGILATVATGVYTGQVQRARIAATHDLINQLEIAITRYEVDLGQIPPSGSGDFPVVAVSSRRDGSGYLHLALVHSINANALSPASSLWGGPYINFQSDQLEASSGTTTPGNIDILDPFGNAIIYVRAEDYAASGSTFTGGARLFNAPVSGQNPDLPAPNPYLAQGETYYNPRGYQLISYGPNGVTLNPSLGIGSLIFKGAEFDDITNFGY